MIRCFDGLLGQGKTYGMVGEARDFFRLNRPMVYTNMAGLKFPEAIYFDRIDQICDIGSGLVLIDEAMIIMSSRNWQDNDREVLGRFAQLRKHGLDLWYTAQIFDGVDKLLRELTSETVTCRKWGKYFQRATGIPSRKVKPGLGKLVPFDPKIGILYDTLELIKTSGGSDGVASHPPLSVAARKRSEDTRRHGGAGPKRKPKGLLRETWWSGWWGDVSVLELGPAARGAYDWLRKEGHFREVKGADPDSDDHWTAQVQRELDRRLWLKQFGLGPEDAPVTCTYRTPWLIGHDPETVKLKTLDRERETAAELLVMKERSARRSRAV